MSEKKKESIAETQVSRRSMLKWTGALAAAAVIGVGVGYEASNLLKPTTTVTPPANMTATTAMTGTATTATTPPVGTPVGVSEFGEQIYYNMWKESGALRVYAKDGRITRMEPLLDGDKPHSCMLASRLRTYNPDRLQYPMKRNGWAPGGKSPIDNRGKADFVRITWEEAFSSITTELKRLLSTYGPSAFLYAPGEHSDSWMFNNRYMQCHDFLSLLGGYTSLGCDGYSWGANRPSGAAFQGTVGGADGVAPQEQISFFLKYSKMFVYWAMDPLNNDIETGTMGEFADDMRLMQEKGIKVVFIGAALNETAKRFADTWIPCHPMADAALAAAIAYTWINEGTYDQAYLDSHSVGFDDAHLPAGAAAGSSFKSYVMGMGPDGIKKTPEWAEPIVGTPARIIRALAREWASKPTGICSWRGCNVNGGMMVRSIGTLLAMQGLGKPGVGVYAPSGPGLTSQSFGIWRDGVKGYAGPPDCNGGVSFPFHDTQGILFVPNVYSFYHVIPPELVDMSYVTPKALPQSGISAGFANTGPRWPGLAIGRTQNAVKQDIRDVLWGLSMDASPDKPIFHRYGIGQDTYLYEYPLPGNSEVHAYFFAGGDYLCRHPNIPQTMHALMSPKFEFILGIDPWMEPDCHYADILLPAVSNYERADVSNRGLTCIYCSPCIEPMFEAKSDFDIWHELANRMGILDKVQTGPNGQQVTSLDAWLELVYNFTTIPKMSGLSWEDYKKVGQYTFQVPDNWHSWEPQNWNWKNFYQNPTKAPLQTESGLLEIYSKSTVKIGAMGQSGYYIHWDPNKTDPNTVKYESPNPGYDPNVPGIGMYIPNPEGPGTPRAKLYPIVVMSDHPKYQYHTYGGNVKWIQDQDHMTINGYSYAPIDMSEKDAADRGIKYGDLVRVFNNQGQILCWAHVSNRWMPGVAHIQYGKFNDFADWQTPGSLDKSGNVENICTGGFCSPFDNQASVQAVAQVEKYTGA
jgi:trimethylamine-N-oxide reductase (cytochrome c)